MMLSICLFIFLSNMLFVYRSSTSTSTSAILPRFFATIIAALCLCCTLSSEP